MICDVNNYGVRWSEFGESGKKTIELVGDVLVEAALHRNVALVHLRTAFRWRVY